MELLNHATVGPLDIFGACGFGDAEYFVVIAFSAHSVSYLFIHKSFCVQKNVSNILSDPLGVLRFVL